MSVERGLYQFGYFIATVIPNLLARLFIKVGNGRPPRVKVSKDTSTEQERMAGCRDVVMQFAVAYGHIARECMTREELEAKIDSGIAPQELTDELYRRIAAMPGVVLGVNTINSNIEIKLPATLRDRHCYIIGKSGSGKTNLIRNMVFQDLADGGGIGMIAPEQELLTEEIMPYVPENRIDDVVYFNPSDTLSPIPFNPLFLADGEDIDLKVDDKVLIR
jgi:hypothetical protein